MTDSTDEFLYPKPHMIKSVRARNLNLSQVMKELFDNAMGHGQAREVAALISNDKGVAVIDDGIGMDDINRLFRFGDASAYDKTSEIGQYGVGAKDSTIWLGDVVEVTTTRDGITTKKRVNWSECEKRGQWPTAHVTPGKPAPPNVRGTTIVVRHLARYFHFSSSERLAGDLAFTYAPGLRDGIKLRLTHRLKNGEEKSIKVEPFRPTLNDEIAIAGEVETPSGEKLKWSGRAGLCQNLTDRQMGVHIAFGYRVIKSTLEPFNGTSAPTLYVEVTLDDTGGWKHALSTLKDEIVRYREDLYDSIHEQLKELLAKAAEQASYIALKGVLLPIEARLNKALKGAGILFVDPEEEPMDPHPTGKGSSKNPQPKTRTPVEDGVPAKPVNHPTGIRIEPMDTEQLRGKLWHWRIDNKEIVVYLDRVQFEETVGWPPRSREDAVLKIVTSYLCHGIEAEYRNGGKKAVLSAFTPKLREMIEAWGMSNDSIAPYLNRAILAQVA